MAKTQELSVIIPTLNEMGNVPELINVLKTELSGISYELIFVDDDSPDLTWKYIQDLNEENVTVIRRIGRSGLASAVVEGFGIAAGEYFLVMDADFQHDAGIIIPMLEKAKEGFGLVVGSRYTSGGSTGQWSAFRKFVSSFATNLAKIFTRVNVSDPMSGFFLVKAGHIKSVLSKLKPIGYKVLLDIIVNSPGIKTAEIPYSFSPRHKGDSKTGIKTVTDFLDYLLEITIGRFISMQFMKYMIVGGTGVLVNFIAFWLCFDVLNAGFNVSLIAAIVISITTNYLLNDVWTFNVSLKKSGPSIPGWIKYNIVCLSGSVINYAISAFQYNARHEWVFSVMLGIIAASVWNYVISKNYVWQ